MAQNKKQNKVSKKVAKVEEDTPSTEASVEKPKKTSNVQLNW